MKTPSLARWSSFAPQFLAVLRMVAGLLFLLAGTTKLFAFPIGMPGGATAIFPSQIWIGAVLEVVGGGLILLGLFTRPVAFLLSGFMAVAYFMAHASKGNVLLPLLNQGELSVLYCFAFLYFVFSGAGAWSVDALREGRKA